MMTRKDLGERIASERERAGITQERLAATVGLERSAISRIEHGEQAVDALKLLAIADALGRHPSVFVRPPGDESTVMLMRAAGARQVHIEEHARWLDDFLADYCFLVELTKGKPS